jgi:hypothetical protein
MSSVIRELRNPCAPLAGAGLVAETWLWVREEGVWWAASFVFHSLLMVALMLASVKVKTIVRPLDAVEISSSDLPPPETAAELDRFPTAPPQLDPGSLDPLTPTSMLSIDPGTVSHIDSKPGGESFLSDRTVPGPGGWNDLGMGLQTHFPTSKHPLRLPVDREPTATRNPLGQRDEKNRVAMGLMGPTKQTDRAVAAALNWIARHQARDGSWSLTGYRTRCTDPTCSGPGAQKADAAATALALLPLLAAGHRHDRSSLYQKTVSGGLAWLVGNQRPDGDLSAGSTQRMYSHGLAAIALCEAYAMSADPRLRRPAQRGVDFIQACQHPRTGGWRYQPGDEGDTSVFGWQLMALKSAEMGALSVRPEVIDRARQWLGRVASGKNKGLFAYTPGAAPPTPSMTAVGLLACQYLDMPRTDPAMVEGAAYLGAHPPDARQRSLYYWYYATQVMHNLLGRPWDDWNRRMRRILVESQVREGCAAGSWDPLRPTRDALGEPGGRLCVTSLSTLTLEVYYRHLPLYQVLGETPLDTSSVESGPLKSGGE